MRHKDVAHADAMLRDHDRLELKFEAGRLKESARGREAGLNLRVVAKGRVGLAGTTDLAGTGAVDDLLARALASAEQGEAVDLAFPARGAVPAARTFDAVAAALTVEQLAVLGRRVVE